MMQRPISQAACVLRRSFQAQQSRTLVSGPPTQRVTFAEKVISGGGIAFGMLATPVWVICHVRSYREKS